VSLSGRAGGPDKEAKAPNSLMKKRESTKKGEKRRYFLVFAGVAERSERQKQKTGKGYTEKKNSDNKYDEKEGAVERGSSAQENC